MSSDTYTCSHCGQWLGITGPGSGTDEDYAAEEHYVAEVDYHERGECTPVAAVEAAPTPDPRAEYIAGLRALADLIESKGLTGRFCGDGELAPLDIHVDTKTEAAAWARALTDVTKRAALGSDNMLIEGRAGGVYMRVWVDRNEVCERVSTGFTTVTRRAQPAIPETTEEVETFDWVCGPLLAEDKVAP